MPRLGLVARRIIPETIPAVGLVIMNGLGGHGRYFAVSSGTLNAKAPSSKPQAPGKLQIPSSNVAVIRRHSSVWWQPDRWPAYLTGGIWNLELGASLEVGLWLLEFRAARTFRFGLDCEKAVWEQR